jgi:hypothetical protein
MEEMQDALLFMQLLYYVTNLRASLQQWVIVSWCVSTREQ